MNGRLALIGGRDWDGGLDSTMAEWLDGSQSRRVTYIVAAPHDASDDFAPIARANNFWIETPKARLAGLGGELDFLVVGSREEADEPSLLDALAKAEWVHLWCNIPNQGMSILKGSTALGALEGVIARGGTVSASASAAMLFGTRTWSISPELADEVGTFWENSEMMAANLSFPIPEPMDCLGWVPKTLCFAHFNRVGKLVSKFLGPLKESGVFDDGSRLVGIDEETALVRTGDIWSVRGPGAVTMYDASLVAKRHLAGEPVLL